MKRTSNQETRNNISMSDNMKMCTKQEMKCALDCI